MSPSAEPATSSQSALEGLRQARRLLRRPDAAALEACVPLLETAIQWLAAVENRLRAPARDGGQAGGNPAEIREIAREVRIVTALVENAGQFYAGLGQLMAVAGQNATYTAQGQIEPQPPLRPKLRLAG